MHANIANPTDASSLPHDYDQTNVTHFLDRLTFLAHKTQNIKKKNYYTNKSKP